MDKMFAQSAETADLRLFMASLAGVYSPLILILAAAVLLF